MSNKIQKEQQFQNLFSQTSPRQSTTDASESKIHDQNQLSQSQSKGSERSILPTKCKSIIYFIGAIILVVVLYFLLIFSTAYIAKELSQETEKQSQSLIDQQKVKNKQLVANNQLIETLPEAQGKNDNQQKKDINIDFEKLQQKVSQLEAQLKQQHQQINQLRSKYQDLIEAKLQNSQNKTKQNLNKETQKFRIRQKMRTRTPNALESGDRYDFELSIQDLINHSTLKIIYSNDQVVWSGIKKTEYERAMRLMEVVHNVNFKGEFVFDHFHFYSSPEEKYQALVKILQEEKKYFDEKYEISKYINDQIGFCVYVPSYNNAKSRLYLRNLDSIFQQEYQNYHVVYVNDASTDGTGNYAKAYMEENQIPAEKYVIINNEKNQGNSANVYMAGNNYCKDGEIMIFLDGDDALIGRQVFSLLNAVYQKQKIVLTYTQFLFVQGNTISNGFSRMIPTTNLKDGTFRKLKSFYTSHLKAMYVDVFKQINVSDFQYDNGTFHNSASDVAYMTPAIQLAGTRLKFLTQIIYQYRFDTGLNEPHFQQMMVQNQIYLKAPYKKMENMSFADNPKTVHYP